MVDRKLSALLSCRKKQTYRKDRSANSPAEYELYALGQKAVIYRTVSSYAVRTISQEKRRKALPPSIGNGLLLFTERFLSVFFDSRANISRHLQNVQCRLNGKASRTYKVCNTSRKRFEMPFFAAFFESLLLDKVTVIAHLIDTLIDVSCNRKSLD